MSKIQLLDQSTINQIAAGEVIDRPASIVKELMENAIDAGSTMIAVEIENGGISYIRITDNGCGIDQDDIRVAFLRHSTSKIKTALDLLSVSSLGFRGEALSSIAAVCQVEMISKTAGDVSAVRYLIEGGKEVAFEEIGAPEGTTFLIRNIFFNTPARRKFLKSAQTESGYISEIIEKIALSHPEISISFTNNKETKLHTSGNGSLKEVIYSIYGRDITNNILEVNFKNEFMSMSGYIGKSIISKGNRSFENYFINGRYIKSNIISKAIEDGYKFILMQHKYPFAVINFEINQELLDVNVHPAKMELRFRKADAIYPFIAENIKITLLEKPNIIDVELEKPKLEQKQKLHVPEPFENKRRELSNHILGDVIEDDTEGFLNVSGAGEPVYTTETNNSLKVNEATGYSYETKEPADNPTENSAMIYENKSMPAYTDSSVQYRQQELAAVSDAFLSDKARKKHKIIGQVFDTYWIIEYEDKMYIIDQHAAHEKVMFEALMDKLQNKQINSQMINPPIILNLSMKEAALLDKYIDNFKEIGFEIELFGGQDYAVRAIPTDLYTLDSEDVLMGIVDNLTADGSKMVPEIITEKIASMSCKAAVKGNSKMSVREADSLIDQLLSLENPYNCPHGRPTIISMSKYELEKKFKRII